MPYLFASESTAEFSGSCSSVWHEYLMPTRVGNNPLAQSALADTTFSGHPPSSTNISEHCEESQHVPYNWEPPLLMSASDRETSNYNSYLTSGDIHSKYRNLPYQALPWYDHITGEECEHHDCISTASDPVEEWYPYNPHYSNPSSLDNNLTPFNSFGSPASTASTPQEGMAWLSDTLHQHAYAKQRRSRHDPGGGASQTGELVTPENGYSASLMYHDPPPPPLAHPSSSSLQGALTEVLAHPGPQFSQPILSNPPTPPPIINALPTLQHPSSPMGHLPYPKNATQHLEVKGIDEDGTLPGPPYQASSSGGRIASPTRPKRAATAPYTEPSTRETKFKRGTPTPVACLFCRKRKLACGGPREGEPNSTCIQCERRKLDCMYPETSNRGRRRK